MAVCSVGISASSLRHRGADGMADVALVGDPVTPARLGLAGYSLPDARPSVSNPAAAKR